MNLHFNQSNSAPINQNILRFYVNANLYLDMGQDIILTYILTNATVTDFLQFLKMSHVKIT